MLSGFAINKPFFEIGPKAFLYGEQALEMALFADILCEKYRVEIIFTAQYTDIQPIAKAVKRLRVFAQHMDSLTPGPGVGSVLPEALKAAGAEGVLLNHSEKPLTLAELHRCIRRAGEAGLATMVCADTPEEGAAVACLGPDIVLAESPALIGAGRRGPGDFEEITRINQLIHAVRPGLPILHGAGIRNERNVFAVISAGAEACGSTSGILKAADPPAMLEKMIKAVRRAWDLNHNQQ